MLIFWVGDAGAVTAEDSLTPLIFIFYYSSESKAETVDLVLPVIVTSWSTLVSPSATARRQLCAFAYWGRSSTCQHPRWMYLSTMHCMLIHPVHGIKVSRRAVWPSIACTCITALINSDSVVGFSAIVSLTTVAITSSYTICIACLSWRRLSGSRFLKSASPSTGGLLWSTSWCCRRRCHGARAVRVLPISSLHCVRIECSTKGGFC